MTYHLTSQWSELEFLGGKDIIELNDHLTVLFFNKLTLKILI